MAPLFLANHWRACLARKAAWMEAAALWRRRRAQASWMAALASRARSHFFLDVRFRSKHWIRTANRFSSS
jgi:hypothetical protein